MSLVGNIKNNITKFIKNNTLENKFIVAGFPGVGKSYAGIQYPDEFIDMESSDYHWQYVGGMGEKVVHPDWPKNYVDAIEKAYRETTCTSTILCVCCSTHKEVLEELTRRGLVFIVVAPKTKDWSINNYIARGSPKEFIDLLDKKYDDFMKDIYTSGAAMIIACDWHLSISMSYFADV